jgi:hypothetical protein
MMTTPKPVIPAPVEDTPPWQEPVAPIRLPNPEAAWVAWWNFSIPVEQYDFENETEYTEYVPLSVTVRDGEPVTNMFEQVAEFAKMALLNGWKPISDKQWHVEDVGKPPVQQASAPLPQAAAPAPRPQPQVAQQGAPRPAAPRPQPQQQGAPQQGERQPYPNPFVANELLITIATNTNDGSTYTKYTLQGMPFVKYGMRVWPDLLDRVGLVDTNGTPASQWQAGKYAIGNWSCSYNYDGNGKPKNVVAMEWVEG